MTKQELTTDLPNLISNLKSFDYYNQDDTTIVIRYNNDKYITFHKQNWSDDLYLMARYSKTGVLGSMRRTSTVTFTGSEIKDIITKVKNTLRGVEVVETPLVSESPVLK